MFRVSSDRGCVGQSIMIVILISMHGRLCPRVVTPSVAVPATAMRTACPPSAAFLSVVL